MRHNILVSVGLGVLALAVVILAMAGAASAGDRPELPENTPVVTRTPPVDVTSEPYPPPEATPEPYPAPGGHARPALGEREYLPLVIDE